MGSVIPCAHRMHRKQANSGRSGGRSFSPSRQDPTGSVSSCVCPVADLVQAAALNHKPDAVGEYSATPLIADGAAGILAQVNNKKPAHMRLWCMLQPQPGA